MTDVEPRRRMVSTTEAITTTSSPSLLSEESSSPFFLNNNNNKDRYYFDKQSPSQEQRKRKDTTTTTTTTVTGSKKNRRNTATKSAGRRPVLILCCMISIMLWLYYYSINFILVQDEEEEIIISKIQQQQQQQQQQDVGYLSFCDSSRDSVTTTTTTTSTSSNKKKYDGILHISQGDSEGAAGTIFFLFVINQLIYAEMYNLFPWIHFNNVSQYIYDPIVHGGNNSSSSSSIKFETLSYGSGSSVVPIISNRAYIDPISKQKVIYPGEPTFLQVGRNNSTSSSSSLLLQKRRKIVTLSGNGVWDNYFEQPVSNYNYIINKKPTTKLSSFGKQKQQHQQQQQEYYYCSTTTRDLPILKLSPSQLISMHIHWPYAVRAWRYGGLPPSLIQSQLTYDEWFAPQRRIGSQIVQKYYKPKQYLIDMAHQVLLVRGGVNSTTTNNNNKNDNDNPVSPPTICLGLHIRHSDKANRRKRIPVKKFLPYAQTYYEEMTTPRTPSSSSLSLSPPPLIYLATDSHKVISNINQNWPSDLVSMIKWQQNIIRSNDTTPVFKLVSSSKQQRQQQQQVPGGGNNGNGNGHHETNVQVLVDILALSHCQFFIHGLSAVSEAVMYLNRDLHYYSFDNNVENRNKTNNSSSTRPTRRRSVNLETAKHPTVDEFRESIRQWKKETNNLN